MKKLNEELSTINFTTEFLDDSEDVMRNYIGYVKNGDDKNEDHFLTSVNMYWDELNGTDDDEDFDDEDFDEEDEDEEYNDFDELPYFEYEFYDGYNSSGTAFYNANKSFFDKFFAEKGFKLTMNDEDKIRFSKKLDVSPTMRTVKKLTKEYIDAMKKAGVVLPEGSVSSDDEEDIDEWLSKDPKDYEPNEFGEVPDKVHKYKGITTKSYSDDRNKNYQELMKEKGLKESLNRSKPKAKTPSYVDDDTSLLDSITKIK